MDAEFKALIDRLLYDDDPSERVAAARALGNYVDDLSDDEYNHAKSALDQAMTDSNPLVLTAVMGAMTRYNRMSGNIRLHGDDKDNILPPQKDDCEDCGRPQALCDCSD